jgi:hypothetical protein
MLIGMSLVHNDFSKGWLGEWLNRGIEIFDKWIILDDYSTDDTVSYIQQTNTDKIILVKNDGESFKDNENIVRSKLWEEVRKIAKEDDWVMCLDSDEIPCEEFEEEIIKIMNYYNNGVVSFKKVEMWNKEEYRIDGLWSNYFVRMFKYENKEWGFVGAGFHNPQIPSFTSKQKFINSDVRIKHLAYYTEELRKQKYDFMMNNPQQKKDITYYHLQTVNDEKYLLKKLEKWDIKKDKKLLIINCCRLYKIPEKTLEYITDNDDNIDVLFLISECNYNLVNQIENIDTKHSEINVRIFNFLNDEELDFLLKKEFLRLSSYHKYDSYFLIDGCMLILRPLIKHHLLTDKDCCVSRCGKLLFFNSNVLEHLKCRGIKLKHNSVTSFVNTIMDSGFYVWGTMNGVPWPANI